MITDNETLLTNFPVFFRISVYPSKASDFVRRIMLIKGSAIIIGHSGSNYSAFYLYRVTSVGLSSTPHYAHA